MLNVNKFLELYGCETNCESTKHFSMSRVEMCASHIPYDYNCEDE